MENSTPTWTKEVQFNSGSSNENILFCIWCNNVPIGSAVSFYAATPLPDGQQIAMPIMTVTNSSDFQLGVRPTRL